jgi:hypothetical protein
VHGSVGSLDFHYDKEPRCGAGCSEALHSAVHNCSEAVNFCEGHAYLGDAARCVSGSVACVSPCATAHPLLYNHTHWYIRYLYS